MITATSSSLLAASSGLLNFSKLLISRGVATACDACTGPANRLQRTSAMVRPPRSSGLVGSARCSHYSFSILSRGSVANTIQI